MGSSEPDHLTAGVRLTLTFSITFLSQDPLYYSKVFEGCKNIWLMLVIHICYLYVVSVFLLLELKAENVEYVLNHLK